MNNDDFTVLVSGGSRHVGTGEHVECSSCSKCSKWQSEYSNESAWNFVLSLNIPLQKLWMIQKATAMGNWWLAASSWQCPHSCIISRAELFGETSSHPRDSAPLQPRFGALQLLAFPQTKITFEREEISNCQWDSGKYDGAANAHRENCVRSQSAYFEGDSGVIVLCTMFLVSSSINV